MAVNFKALASAVLSLMLSAPAWANSPGVSDDRILFGQTVGIKSVWGEFYTNYTAGLMGAFRQVNERGGVHGRKIDVQRVEDNYNPEKAVANIEAFAKQNEVFGLVCIGGTGVVAAAQPVIERLKIPTVGALTGADSARRFNPYLFFTRSSYTREVEKMFEHLTSLGLTKIAVIYQDNTFGKGMNEVATKAAKARNAQIIATLPHGATATNFDGVVDDLQKSEAQAVLMFTAPEAVVGIVQTYRARTSNKIPQPWVLSVTSPKLLYEKLKEDARGIAVTQVLPPPNLGSSPMAREFQLAMDLMNDKSHRGYDAYEGYLSGRIVIEALRRAGRNLTRESYIHALESFGTDYKLLDIYVTYTPKNHMGPPGVDVTMIDRSGRLVR